MSLRKSCLRLDSVKQARQATNNGCPFYLDDRTDPGALDCPMLDESNAGTCVSGKGPLPLPSCMGGRYVVMQCAQGPNARWPARPLAVNAESLPVNFTTGGPVCGAGAQTLSQCQHQGFFRTCQKVSRLSQAPFELGSGVMVRQQLFIDEGFLLLARRSTQMP